MTVDAIEAQIPGGEDIVKDGLSLQFLTFLLGEEEYGVNIMQVKEIRGWADTTRLPNSPDFIRGVINLRGVVVPIIDLRRRFGMKEAEITGVSVVIVLALERRTIGVLVDAVSDIVDVVDNDIKPVPVMSCVIDESYLTGLISLDERMVILLDAGSLFDAETLELADEMDEQAAASV